MQKAKSKKQNVDQNAKSFKSEEDCVFCKVVAGELPSYKVYEDEKYYAFLDIRPLNSGHCLVVPKRHCRYVDQVEDFGEYFEVAKKVGEGIKKATGHEHIYYLCLGNLVEHAHIWVLPHFEGDGHGTAVNFRAEKKIDENEMKRLAGEIRAVVENK